MDVATRELTDRLSLDTSAHKIEELAGEIRQELLEASAHDLSKSRVVHMRKMAERIVHDTQVSVAGYRW
jgi:hypothetical protein